jgi:hypothetical protein
MTSFQTLGNLSLNYLLNHCSNKLLPKTKDIGFEVLYNFYLAKFLVQFKNLKKFAVKHR